MVFTECLIVLWICTNTQAVEYQIGDTIKLQCNLPASFTQFSWTRSGTLLAEYNNVTGELFVSKDSRVEITLQKDGNLGKLIIKEITSHDTGNYTCTAYVSNGPSIHTLLKVTVVESTSTKLTTVGTTSFKMTTKEKGPTTDYRNSAASSSFPVMLFLCCYVMNIF
ncbi:uncharacterized protein LOC133183505 isoform X1 [Saccostrea echinata]|uniref:uncharacterized protein LOC133183505 isoform X1 n=1 Tax=Saccostrea echinata TaxID=191078 RepID=UPI002A7F475F|nr:uncharacterized protein LOC133183505 isoform X1 [Saccostrea echinata]